MNRYTDITPALYSERETEENSLMGGGVSSCDVPAVSSWDTVVDPLWWKGQCTCRQEWALGTSRIEDTQERQGRAVEWVGGPGCSGMLPSSPPGGAVPIWQRAVWGQVTSVKRKEMAAKANDHPYL